MAMYAGMFGGGRDDRDGGSNPIALLAMMIFAPMAAMMIQMAISRSREFAADAGAAAITDNPRALADALRKIDAIAQPGAARRQPGDGAHVHRQAVLGRGLDVAVQHASADRSSRAGAAAGRPVSKRRPPCGWRAITAAPHHAAGREQSVRRASTVRAPVFSLQPFRSRRRRAGAWPASCCHA